MAIAGVTPFDQRDGFIWMDGQMVPWRDAKIHVLSHGLHYAGSVFEGLRVYDGLIFKLQAHTDRLIKSAQILDMHIPFTADEINQATKDVLTKNNLTNAYIRPVAWRGTENMGLSAKGISTHLAIAAWEWGTYFTPKAGAGKGVALQTSKYKRPDPLTAPTESKAAALYALNTMAKHAADAAGYDDALMLDYRGYVAEATAANLFMIKDGKIKTPIPDCFLNGITRQTVIDLARGLGIEVEICHIQPDALLQADEIFLTGTAAEITPVGQIDGTHFSIGDVTQRIQAAYKDAVKSPS